MLFLTWGYADNVDASLFVPHSFCCYHGPAYNCVVTEPTVVTVHLESYQTLCVSMRA